MRNWSYIFVTSSSTWYNLRTDPRQLWPLKSRYARQLSVDIDDEIIVYLNRVSCLVAILRVKGKIQPFNSLYADNNYYEYAIPVAVKNHLDVDAGVPIKPIVDKLQLTRRVHDNWGCKFQKAVVKINEHDQLVLSSILNSKMNDMKYKSTLLDTK